jgi:hypothetical protein
VLLALLHDCDASLFSCQHFREESINSRERCVYLANGMFVLGLRLDLLFSLEQRVSVLGLSIVPVCLFGEDGDDRRLVHRQQEPDHDNLKENRGLDNARSTWMKYASFPLALRR